MKPWTSRGWGTTVQSKKKSLSQQELCEILNIFKSQVEEKEPPKENEKDSLGIAESAEPDGSQRKSFQKGEQKRARKTKPGNFGK